MDIDLTNVPAGIYFCEMQVDGKPMFSEKYVLIK
jgi:hypothetical protein